MKKIYLFICCLVCVQSSIGQTITLNTGNPSASTTFSGSAPFVITFTLENKNNYPIIINDIDVYRGTNSNGTVCSLYYSTTSLSGSASGWATNPAWTFITSTPVSSVTASGIYPTFANLSFTIPANTTYRFLQASSGSAIVCGSTTSTPNNWTLGGLLIGAGNYQINNANVGYAASGSSTPYFWAGTVHFVPAVGCSAPVAGAATVSNPAPCNGTTITLNLTGNNGGLAQTYQWQSSLFLGGPYTNVGSIQYYSDFSTSASGSKYYRCVVSCNTASDTSTPVLAAVPALFPAGTYTINSALPTGSGNFQTFADAASAINCGVTGPIIFNVTPGVYNNDRFLLDSFINAPGVSVTINGSGATISNVSTLASEAGVIRLNGTRNVTIDSLRINAISNSTSQYGWGIHLLNNADTIVISNCIITLDTTVTSANYVGIAISGSMLSSTTSGSKCDAITINNNVINGGYYGITLLGASGTANLSQNSIITNNTLRNFYSYGIYAQYTNNILIENNDISRPSRTSVTTFYGIYHANTMTGARILRNRIHDPAASIPTASFTAYGINLSSSTGTAALPNTVANNLIYNMQGGGTGIHYNMYNSSSAYTRFYYNTVSSDYTASSGTGITYGYYQTGNVAGIEFKNNNISITRGSTGALYGIYLNTATTTFTSNNNNLYVNGANGPKYVGYNTTGAQSTLSGWQSAQGQDANSTTLLPQFLNPAAGDFTPTNGSLDNMGTPIAGITTDINNNPRSATTPDIGAYEFVVPLCSGLPSAGIATGPAGGCSGSNISMLLTGYTIGVGIGIQWQSSPAGVNLWSNISGATNPNYSATITASTDYRVMVTCSNSGLSDSSNVVAVALNPFYYCYCSPLTGTALHTNVNNYITNVLIPGSTLNYASASVGVGGYTQTSHLNSASTATLYMGSSYTLNVQLSAGQPTYNVAAWIDFDQSGTFDTSEFFQLTSLGGVASATISIPSTALTGLTGMRLRVSTPTTYYTSAAGCTSMSTGYETEDYVITIGATPACTIPSGLNVANLTSTSADVSWTIAPLAFYYEYAVDQSYTAQPDISSTITNSFVNNPPTVTSLTPSTVYYLHVRSFCGSVFSPWHAFSFTTPPPNDDCLNAVSLSNGLPTPGTTVGATQSMPSGTCAASTTYANDVWYHFTTTATGTIVVTASCTVGDLVLEVLSGSCGSFTQLDCQDGPAIGTETATLTNLAAGTYYVRVYGYVSIQNPFIVQASGTTLAIDLKEISATNVKTRNRIDWITEREDAGDHFELERSTDGEHFITIAQLKANETPSSYTYWDEAPEMGVNYYRLKMLDISNRASYSRIVNAILREAAGFNVKAYPNPVKDVLTIVASGTSSDIASITVTDATGKVLKAVKMLHNNAEVDMKGIAAGIYFIKYESAAASKTIRVNKE